MTEKQQPIDTGTDQLLCRLDQRVAVITLNRPEARNALSDQLTPALRRLLAQFDSDNRVGVVVLTGAGTAFCAGGDVKGMGAAKAAPKPLETAIVELQQKQRTLTGLLYHFSKPTLALLPGPAAGAGLAIAMATDIRIAADSAFLATGYARVALSGDYGINWLLSQHVGTAKARELMFTNARIEAAEALQLGLVNKVVPFNDLAAEGFAMARQIAAGPAKALAMMKQNLNNALEIDFLTALDREAERLLQCSRDPDHKEAVRAFVEKRAPDFSHGSA